MSWSSETPLGPGAASGPLGVEVGGGLSHQHCWELRHPPWFLLPRAVFPFRLASPLALKGCSRQSTVFPEALKDLGPPPLPCCWIQFTHRNIRFLICKTEIRMLPDCYCSRIKGNDVCESVEKSLRNVP